MLQIKLIPSDFVCEKNIDWMNLFEFLWIGWIDHGEWIVLVALNKYDYFKLELLLIIT